MCALLFNWRFQTQAAFERVAPILAVLCAAKRSVNIRTLYAIIANGCNVLQTLSPEELLTVPTYDQFVDRLVNGRMFPGEGASLHRYNTIRDFVEETEGGIRLAHTAFKLWLLDKFNEYSSRKYALDLRCVLIYK